MSWRLAVQAGGLALRAPNTGLPDARRWGRAVVATVLGVLVAAIVSLIAQWIFGKLNAPWPSYVRPNVVALTTSVIALLCLGLLLLRTWTRWTHVACWVGLALLTTVPMAAALIGTKYYFGGVSVDQNFRTEYLTRMASSPALADFAYQGVAPYYPVTWFWFGGRFANLVGLPGWAAFKPWAILTFAVVAIVTYELWSLFLTRKVAFILSLATSGLGVSVGADEPYSWLLTAVLPPLAVLAWLWASAVARRDLGPGRTAGMIALGVAVGIFGDLYTLHMVFFALLLVIIGLVALAQHRSGAVALLWRYVVAGVIAVVVMIPVWGLYILAMLGGASSKNLALHYLPAPGAQIPLPMLDFSVIGVATLAGTVWVLLQLRRSDLAAALGITAATCYLWFWLSYAVLVLDTTLLAFRLINVLVTVLMLAGVLAAIGLARMAIAGLSRRRLEVRVMACLFGFGFLISTIQGAPAIAHTDDSTFGDYYPTGVTPVGRHNPADTDYWVPQLNAAITTLTHRRPDQNILLSSQPILTVTAPYWSYQAASPHYANPLGQFTDRNEQIRAWSRIRDPQQMADALASAKYRAPSVFVFKRSAQGLTFRISTDIFPAQPNVKGETLTFDPAAFRGPQFARRDVGPFTVIART